DFRRMQIMATAAPAPDDDDGAADSLRDTLDAAFEQHADDGPGADAPAAPAPPAAAPVDGAPARDPAGRFAPKGGQAPAAGLEGAQAPAQQQGGTPGAMPPAPQPTELKAPESWTPQAREKWA